MLASWKIAMANLEKPRQCIKEQRHLFANKVHIVKESWVLKNWCFWTVVLEKTLESLLDCKEIKPVHPKGNQPWIFIGRTNAEAETPILWPPDAKEPNHWKRPWCWERLKAGREGDDRGRDGWMASPTQWHEFEQAPGDGEGQRSLVCCSPWGRKDWGMI